MTIILLQVCAHRTNEQVNKISLKNYKRLLRKLQKNLRGYFFAAPCIFLARCFRRRSRHGRYNHDHDHHSTGGRRPYCCDPPAVTVIWDSGTEYTAIVI